MRQLLRQLARHPDGLCVITTRIAVHELSDRQQPVVISHDLQNLCEADGVRLLQSLGVTGSQAELKKAVREYGGHALALSLLGNAVCTYLDGDIRQRDTLDALIDAEDRAGHHAFKVMRAYQHWLQGSAELKLLYLLGLFDHPVETGVLQVLWAAQIPGLTDGIAEKSWKAAIHALRDQHHLLSAHEGRPDLLDCHPLIREYFGGQLKAQQPEGWRQAHERLYEYYKALPEKELPDTLEEMQPLFSAVAHGCAAGLHQQALDEVYWPRIQRENEYFCVNKLGAFSDDLATISHFFTAPWHTPAAGLTESDKALLLNWSGAWLRALGRLREALEPMQANIDMNVKRENWESAAVNASNLSELQLTLGDVVAASDSGQRSVDYADQSGDWAQRMGKRTTHADALHQAGEAEAALALFREAEQLQQERQPEYPRLYSLRGFQYCDLLLAQGGTAEVLERYEQWVKWRQDGDSLLDRSLEYLTLGRAHFQQAVEETPPNLPLSGEGQEQAAGWLEQAVAGLRAAGQFQYLPLGLLARAALHRASGDFARARQDLQEVFDIAEPSGMRLFLTDWHLEVARLLLTPPSPTLPPQGGQGAGAAAQPSVGATLPPSPLAGEGRDGGLGGASEAAYHIAEAAKLIAATGYHRRDPELAELQQAISAIPQ